MTSKFIAPGFGLVLVAGLWAIAAQAQTAGPSPVAPPASVLKIEEQDIEDFKSVFATVRSKDRIEARVRTPGTVVSLKVDEGAHVVPGQVLALVADPKIALKIKALDAQIAGLESRVATAKIEFERSEQLRTRGVSPQARVDQARTAFDVATNDLKAARSERMVAEQQISEGQVLAPAAGRILKVPVTEGSVVMPGESIATIAANAFLLRLELPERHARFMKKGDPVKLGARETIGTDSAAGEGRIIQVYPELQGGRVIADAEVSGLSDYFVGERALVWISVGKRRTIIVPAAYVFTRFGLDYVKLDAGSGRPLETVVQVGQRIGADPASARVEVLSGLRPNDLLLRPEAKQ